MAGTNMTDQYIITEERLREILQETCKGATWVKYQWNCICSHPYNPQAEREKVLTERNIKALERVIGFAFSYRPTLSEESQEDIKIADDLYHKLKALRQEGKVEK